MKKTGLWVALKVLFVILLLALLAGGAFSLLRAGYRQGYMAANAAQATDNNPLAEMPPLVLQRYAYHPTLYAAPVQGMICGSIFLLLVVITFGLMFARRRAMYRMMHLHCMASPEDWQKYAAEHGWRRVAPFCHWHHHPADGKWDAEKPADEKGKPEDSASTEK